MYPLLRDGDIVHIKKISFSELKVNDIVCVKKLGKTFTHRVIYKNENYLITKGDNNKIADEKIYSNNIIGKVYKVNRGNEILYPEYIYLLQSTLYFKEIVKVKKALEKDKIGLVFLKGLPLHLYFEGHHPKRIYADCDLLIKKSQYNKAARILRNLGYSKVDTALSKTQKLLKDKEVESNFCKLVNGLWISLDIHLEVVFLMVQLGKIDKLYPQNLIDQFSTKLLKEKRYIELNNQKFPILSKENLFIYLILHLYHHNFQGTYRFDLIEKLISKEKLNYKMIVKTITSFRLDNFIFPCLVLFKKYYKIGKSNAILSNLNPSKQSINFVQRDLRSIDIFNDEDRVSSGIKRFKNIFLLSPNNLFKKTLIFFSPKILLAIIWVSIKRIGLR